MKKLVAIVLCLCLALTMLTACGGANSSSQVGSTPTSAGSGQTKPLRWAIKASEAGRQEIQNLIDLAAENGIQVETVVLPDPAAGEADKLLISLMGGESFDLFMTAYANAIPYYNAGVLEPLDSYAEQAGYDVEKTFGQYPARFDDQLYGMPAFVDTAVTLYNKALFDKAGIPYPTAENWTWEEFIRVGKQLTNEAEGIYGAFNPLWAHYNYMYAMQKGAEHYKADGTSNYDDPLFKEALKFYYDLGNVEHVNPEYLVQKSKQMPLDYFTSGNIGMSVAGGWTTVWLTDTEKYPRDWKAGMLPMPYPEGEKPSTSVVVSNFYVPATSEQKELAFQCAALFAENMYLMGGGRVPARVDLTDEEINSYIESSLAPSLANDGITVEEIRAAWFNPEIRPFDEKVVGAAAADINKAFMDEGGLYAIGEQDLDTTMANIKARADKAIQDTAEQ
ncbi:extracellular solute-binding protein [Gemmiger sp. An120]|uniref:ABC transporter substrate-binding protein n=1 Tax=Gemmiger sp. An120 TaxID=1965549 RepID=UPI001302D8FE|nr:extracellular solute-binding protein [Gemmiger sp. An120]